MSIVTFGDVFTFPDGQAATSRVYTYAKGLKEHGVNLYVICFANNYVEVPDGVSQGVPYFHPFNQKKRNPYFLVRRWQNIVKNFRNYRILKRINREDKITVIHCYANLFLTYIVAWFFSKIFRAKLIIEATEHPLREYQQGVIRRKWGELKFYIESHLCDGVFCISRYLMEFYLKGGISQRKLFLVPSTVDPHRFVKTSEKPFTKPYIGYFGSLTFKRDNLDLLINAFARLNLLYPDVNLVLGGFSMDEEMKKILRLIKELDIASKVTILNELPRAEILKYITNADILAMVRSKDLESNASFPSKLTEFMSTGIPVVSVDVGEISDYLTDNVNAFLVEHGNIEALTDKLDFIYKNYEFAREVAKKGKELTSGVFNYNYQAKKMIEYLNSLNNS